MVAALPMRVKSNCCFIAIIIFKKKQLKVVSGAEDTMNVNAQIAI